MNELNVELKKIMGLYPRKISFLLGEDLVLLLSTNKMDHSFDVKIRFSKVLGFHCAELLNTKIDFIDVGLLGFKYLTHARQNGHDISKVKQIVLMGENDGNKAEIIVACSDVDIEWTA